MGGDPAEEKMRRDSYAYFEEKGYDEVKLSVATGGISGLLKAFAVEWLADLEKQGRLRTISDQTEMQASVARSAEAAERSALAAESQARTAIKALNTARIAAVIAAIALIISIYPFL